ncbi:MAG: HAD family hydrolase [Candidimonas sp.]|nr:MAG: HAD family hydrolase [Candidimonas sp.]
MTDQDGIVFLFDVDNTLLDNDRVTDDLRRHLVDQFGKKSAERYWVLFEALRAELGYTDYLGALQRYRLGLMNDPSLLRMSSFLLEYPFVERLYPGALEVLDKTGRHGTTVILSDGDAVFQPRKVERSGLWDAVGGRVLIYIHKERMMDAVMERYPARHYVMVDDKLRILAAMKKRMGARLLTVFPRQGHYAHDLKTVRLLPPADITVEHIGDLLEVDLPARLRAPGAEETTREGTS